MSGNRRQFLQLAGAAAGASCFPSCRPNRFQFQDVVVSDPKETLIDPEFSEAGLYMAWVDREHNLWVNDVDAETGTWIPANGRQVRVDSSLAPVGDTRQGIEWAHAHDGPRMVYTIDRDSERSLRQARLIDGEWVTEDIEESAGLWLFQASKDEDDHRPRVIVRRERSPTRFGWREIDDPSTQEWIPGVQQQVLWLRGGRAAVVVDSNFLPFTYDIDTHELRPVASGDSSRHSFPSGFRDESGTTFIAVLDDTRIGIYRETGGSWTLARTMRPDSDLPFVYHPKVWFHRGQLVLTFMMATETSGKVQNRQGTAEVWMATFTEGQPAFRMVNDPSIERIKDTEGLSLPGGFFVYYAQILPNRRRLIHRCHSGL